MSSFKRSFLKSIGCNDDQIGAIMDAHQDVVTEITADRDKYKADAEKLPEVQKQLDAEKQKNSGKDYKKLYEDLKAENEGKATYDKKKAAFVEVLKSAGIADKYQDSIIRVSRETIDALELDDAGKAKNASDLAKSQKETWPDFVAARGTEGDHTEEPPPGGNTKLTRDQIWATTDRAERRRLIAQNLESFE